MTSKLRKLTSEERTTLELRGCMAEDWERVLVAEDFATEQLRHVRLEGDIRIGSRSRIIDSTVINYYIGDDCLIDSVLRMECRHVTTFGEGIEVAAVNENGGRSATIYRELTAQTAYLMTMMRNRTKAVERLCNLIRERAEKRRSEVGIVENDVRILGVRFLREVRIESGARIEGASLLENGTIGRNVKVGIDVRAENFIFDDNSRIDGAASIERCFVGENSILANGFTAVDTLFFANCHCENGEAASVFAGPFTVSHHKSSLLIAGIFSFFNAGSGTNQSNHLFKSGAVHQAVHQRGTKFGSSAYVMAPSIEGAFTVVLGRHTRHHDTQDMPYSYLIEKDGETLLMPALSLKSYGTVRDIQKWKARDKRKVKRDIINFEEFNPFITGKMLRGVDTLNRMYENDPEAKEYVYNRTTIRATMLTRGIKMYNSAIAASLGTMLSKGRYSAAEYDGTEWIDVAGQYISLGRVEKILDQIASSDCTLEHIDDLFREAAESYDDMAAAYAYNILAEMMCHAPSEEEVQEVIASADRIIERMREATDADRLRDESFDMMVGYGYDFRDEAERANDFRATR